MYDQKILVTGGLGYIGVHVCVQLLESNFNVVVIDNFSNSARDAPDTINTITGRAITLYEGDLCDVAFVRKVFQNEIHFSCVVHLAALVLMHESLCDPVKYYDINVTGSIALLKIMCEHHCKRLVFSSSSAVYADAKLSLVSESDAPSPKTPYATSKVVIEELLISQCHADPRWTVAILRLFKPASSHPSGDFCEPNTNIKNSSCIENLVKVATGMAPDVTLENNGLTAHDYVHVMDAADGFVSAVCEILNQSFAGIEIINIGSGIATTDNDLIDAFQDATGTCIHRKYTESVSCNVTQSGADISKALRLLMWKPNLTLSQICVNSIPHQYIGTFEYNNHCIKNIHELCQQTMRKCELLSRENAMSSTMLSRKVDIASDLCSLIESFGDFHRQWKYIGKDKQRVLHRSRRAPAVLSKL